MFDEMGYQGKRVLITGHTGFKGAWMCEVLLQAGAQVTGYALKPLITESNLFDTLSLAQRMESIIGDIRDLKKMQAVFEKVRPEIVIHMAAQPLVRESYKAPVYTYDVNVMGTVNVLECIRLCDSVGSFVNVTTDKVYKNKEWDWGYRENEELNGYDPYSNSKSCSELVTESYQKSFFAERNVAITTMRAGNVIGGGDFAEDRIIPDCVRAVMKNQDIVIRNPHSVRPFQHVLEPVMAYLMVALSQYEKKELAGSYNVGPKEEDCLTAGALADLFCEKWEKVSGKSICWKNKYDGGPHEAQFLKLDCSRLKKVFKWNPVWDAGQAVEKVAEWFDAYQKGEDLQAITWKQIEDYYEDKHRCQ